MAASSRPARRRSKTIRRIVLCVSALLLCVVAGLAYKGWLVYQRADVLRQDLRALEAAPKQITVEAFSALSPLIDRAHADAVVLQAEAAPLYPLARFLGWLPRYGHDIAAAEPLIHLAVDATGAAGVALDVGLPLLRERDAGRPLPEIAAAGLASAQPQLLRVRELFSALTETMQTIPVDSLSPLLRDPLTRAAPLLAQAREGIDIAVALPEILGANGQRTYLLLIQDPKELRATGGFIGGAGTVTLEQGGIAALQVEPSEMIDNLKANPYPDPPQPMLDYMSVQLWLFRDSNWSPDFPTSARAAMNLYKLGRGQEVDGVIAIDPALIQAVLRIIGPVLVENEPQAVTADTIFAYMAGQYNAGFPRTRKAFFGPLAHAVQAKFASGKLAVDFATALKIAHGALDERHALIYLKHATANALLSRYGWDGAVRPGSQDFLMVVDSNVGYNKTNGNVQQVVSYTVNLQEPAVPWSEVRLRYDNAQAPLGECVLFGYRNQQASDQLRGCYWDYLRVLTPGGSKLITATVQTIPGNWLPSGDSEHRAEMAPADAETTEFSTIMVVATNERREIKARYSLPATVVVREGNTYHYRLKIQKQPRAENVPLRVSVKLPRDAVLVSTSAAPQSNANNQLVFDLRLTTDQQVDVVFRAR